MSFTCTSLFRRYWSWLFKSFLIYFLIQIFLILIFFYQIGEISIEFNKLNLFDLTRQSSSSNDNKDLIINEKYINNDNRSSSNLEKIKANQLLSNCTIDNDDSSYLLSAIERAKTEHCKLEIKKVYCLHQTNQLYANELTSNQCTIKSSIFKSIGCYLNNRRPSIISSVVFRYKKANELRCSYLCTQMNAKFFGIENATLCHCLHDLPSKQLRINKSLCNLFCDHKTKSVRCGGEYLISIYETGLLVSNNNQNLNTSTSFSNQNDQSIKIAFLFSINGRSIRQVIRLINKLYDRKHVYFIHVDKQNDFLYNYLNDEISRLKQNTNFTNLIVTDQRFYTIWGGSQLLQMLLNSFQYLLMHYKWDYVINLSESDYPIKSLSDLENYLYQYKGKNFLKFHGQQNDAFIRKQGLEVLFHQCDQRMWRLNKQRKLIEGINFTGGSDWIALHRKFVDFLINDQSNKHLIDNLKLFYNYTLLPAESFFHTLLHSSQFCTQLINNNLRYTNWKRKIGCKCQYRKIVDWCGCSPNVYRGESDWLKLKSTLNKSLFFARKFDPLIDHSIINQIESTYNPKINEIINLKKYWHNEYHYKYDDHLSTSLIRSTYSLLSTIALKDLSRLLWINCLTFSSYEMLIFSLKSKTISTTSLLDDINLSYVDTFINRNKYIGSVVSLNYTTNLNQFDQYYGKKIFKLSFLISPNHQHKFKVYNIIDDSFQLISLKVCTDYDVKEKVFRNFGCIISNKSQLTVQHVWKNFRVALNTRSSNNYVIKLVWISPVGKHISSSNNEIITLSNSLTNNFSIINDYIINPTFDKALEVGEWKLLFIISNFNSNSLQVNFVKPSIADHQLKMNKNSKDSLNKILNDINKKMSSKPQSRIIGETKFLVIDDTIEKEDRTLFSTLYNRNHKLKAKKIVEQLSSFWKIEDVCLHKFENQDNDPFDLSFNQCKYTIKNCLHTTWSSHLSDPKSSFDSLIS